MAGRLAGRETYDIGFRAAVVAGAQGATETGSFIVGMRGDAENTRHAGILSYGRRATGWDPRLGAAKGSGGSLPVRLQWSAQTSRRSSESRSVAGSFFQNFLFRRLA